MIAERTDAVTYISASWQTLYRKEFFDEQKQTMMSQPPSAEQAKREHDAWRGVAPTVREEVGYDSVIISFYESIIAELHRELARYKQLLAFYVENSPAEQEPVYSPSNSVPLPESLARKMFGRGM